MPRPPRIDVEDGWCHVMNRGADRRNVFFDDSDRIEFGVRLADIYDRFGVETHAYCLMDNHYHTLFHCPGGQMSAAMQRLGSLYTRHINDRLGRDGALFRVPPPWMVTSTVLGAFNGDAAAFDHFVADHPDVAELAVPTTAIIRAVVETAELVLAEKALDDRGRIRTLARSLALAWARDAGASNELLLEAFDLESTTALHSAVSRARSKVSNDEALSEATRLVLSLVSPSLLQKGSDPGCKV